MEQQSVAHVFCGAQMSFVSLSDPRMTRQYRNGNKGSCINRANECISMDGEDEGIRRAVSHLAPLASL